MIATKTYSQHSIQSPFGMVMPGRNWQAATATGYGFGFNKQLKDNEIYGENLAYNALYWQYNPRTASRWNTDPVVKPWEAPYITFNSNPTRVIDHLGNDGYVDEDGNFLGDDGDDKSHNTRVINKDTWDKTLGDTKIEDINEEMRTKLQSNITTDENGLVTGGTSKLLQEYEKGIFISNDTWKKLELNGGTKLEPYLRNNSDATVYYKPEGEMTNGRSSNPYTSSNEAYAIEPQTDLYSPVDGVATKYNWRRVYKATTGSQVWVHKKGQITTRQLNWIDYGVNSVKGGWKDKSWLSELHKNSDFSWDALFEKAQTNK